MSIMKNVLLKCYTSMKKKFFERKELDKSTNDKNDASNLKTFDLAMFEL